MYWKRQMEERKRFYRVFEVHSRVRHIGFVLLSTETHDVDVLLLSSQLERVVQSPEQVGTAGYGDDVHLTGLLGHAHHRVVHYYVGHSGPVQRHNPL